MTLTNRLIEQFNKMDEAQQRLLNFARILTRTPALKGEAGTSIVKATGFFDTHSLDEVVICSVHGFADNKSILIRLHELYCLKSCSQTL